MSKPTDPLPLAQALIRRPSVTPADEGALDVLAEALRGLGFVCHDLGFGGDGRPSIRNLYARRGEAAPNLCFAGHTDVVPVGGGWTREPFAGEVSDGMLYGRGAADMKGAIACFVAAVARFLEESPTPPGSVSLLITGDEEGPALDGTRRVLEWLEKRGEKLDACLVGEPTNPDRLGQMIKIGRRGSLNGRLVVRGIQGHTAYPHLAENPIPRLMRILRAITDEPLDSGTAHFQPSTIEITTIDVGNPATNVIPGEARAGFNIRFNDAHSGASLSEWLRRTCDAVGGGYSLDIEISGESFLTPPGPLTEALAGAIRDIAGVEPELSTSGGTSDARFIKDHCPVCEFGLVGRTMHKADECVATADMETLTRIYHELLRRWFRA